MLFGADPSRSGSEVREVIRVDLVRFLVAQDVERARVFLCWLLQMNCFVEVVVDDLAEVNQAAFVDLDFALGVELQPGGMNEAKISDEVLAVDRADHELRLPELLVVGDVVVARFAFTDLENGPVAVEENLDVLELLSVDLLELEDQPLRWNLQGFQVDESSLQIARAAAADVTQLDLA